MLSTSSAYLMQNDAEDDVEFEPTIAQTIAGTGQISFKYRSSSLTGETDMVLRASFLSTEDVSQVFPERASPSTQRSNISAV